MDLPPGDDESEQEGESVVQGQNNTYGELLDHFL